MTLFELEAVLSLSTSAYEKGLDDAKAKAEGFGSSVGSSIGKGFAAVGAASLATVGAIGAGMVQLGKDSVETGMAFDEAMSQVAATTGVTMEEFNNTKVAVDGFNGTLREFAMEQGAKTAFSATECAEALNYMALAGYNAQTQAEMLSPLLNLAAAGSMELATASDMVTDTQSALGLSLEQTNLMIDQMAKGASTTNTSVEQLGSAMLTVGGTAKDMKGGTEEIIQVLGLLADNGIKGAEAGTHLRNMILSLSSPSSDAAAAAIDKLGISLYDSEGKMRDFEDVFLEMQNAMAGMTDEEKSNLISDIFNKADLKAVNALLNTNAERWAEVEGALEACDGAAEQMANTQLDNLSGDVTLLGSAFDSLKIGISDELTPTLRDFVQLSTSGIESITEGISTGGIEGALAGIDTFLSEAVAKVSQTLPPILEAASSIFGSLLNAVASSLPTVIGAIAGVLPDIANALISAVGTLLSNAGAIIEPILQAIPALLDAIVTGISNNADTLINGIIGLIDVIVRTLPSVISQLIKTIVKALPDFVKGIATLVSGIVKELPVLWQSIFTELPSLIEGISAALVDLLPALLDAITMILESVVQAQDMMIDILIPMLPPIIDALVQALVALYPVILQSLVTLAEMLVTFGIEMFSNAVQAIKTLDPILATAVKSSIATMWNAVTTELSTVGSKLIEKIGEIWNAFTAWWLSNFETAKTFVANYVETLVSFWSSLPSKIGEFIGAAVATVLNFGIDVGNWIKDDLPTLIDDLVEWFKGLPEKIWTHLKEIITKFGEWLTNAKDWVVNDLPEVITDIVDKFAELPDDIMEVGENLVKGLWDGIISMKDWLLGKIGEFSDGVIEGFTSKFDINSPSKVMRDQVGRYIAEGVGVGIAENVPLDDVDSMVNDIIDEAGSFTVPVSQDALSFRSNALANALDSSAQKGDTYLNLTLEVDREAFGKMVYKLNNEQSQIAGVNMVEGFA